MKSSLWKATRSAFGLINTMTILLVWIFAMKYVVAELRERVDPFSSYFRPLWMYIPDHCAGNDPMIHYGRAVDKAFLGAYHGAWKSPDADQFPIGVGATSPFPYEPKPYKIVSVPLSVFIGKRNPLPPPGRWHRIETWDRLIPGRRAASLSLKSNDFTVWPATDPRCAAR